MVTKRDIATLKSEVNESSPNNNCVKETRERGDEREEIETEHMARKKRVRTEEKVRNENSARPKSSSNNEKSPTGPW